MGTHEGEREQGVVLTGAINGCCEATVGTKQEIKVRAQTTSRQVSSL
jgi:hypothetical protein